MNNGSEININTTDTERNSILSNSKLLVIPCTKSIDSKIGRFRLGDDLLRAAKKAEVIGKKVNVKDFTTPFTIYRSTIDESAKEAFHSYSPEEATRDMLTIISDLTSNAELLQVEFYRHNKGIRDQISEERQYLCAFEKEGYIYPTKITIEKHHKIEESKIHFIVASRQIKKEVLPSLVPQHNAEKHGVLESPLPYEVNISDIASNFKREHSFLIKHFPDEMLSENQRKWKHRTIRNDLKKEGLLIDELLSQEQIDLKRALIIKDIQKEGYEVDDSLTITKVTPSAIYPNENRIVIPYTVKGISPSAFDEIDVSNVNIFIKNKHETNLSEIVNSEKGLFKVINVVEYN